MTGDGGSAYVEPGGKLLSEPDGQRGYVEVGVLTSRCPEEVILWRLKF